jgi:hypothetical protein
VISAHLQKGIVHSRVYSENGMFFLSLANQKRFSSVSGLIEHYRYNPFPHKLNAPFPPSREHLLTIVNGKPASRAAVDL